MSEAKKLAAAATATPKAGDGLLLVQDGQIKQARIGFKNGAVPIVLTIPSAAELTSAGYLISGTGNYVYRLYAATLRYLADKYPDGGVFLCFLSPQVWTFAIIGISANGKASDGLPLYSCGLSGIPWNPTLIQFGTSNGVYYYK